MAGNGTVVRSNGVDLATRVDGDSGRPWLVLANSLASTLASWDRQIPTLTRTHRVLRFDTRGHGGSAAPPGPYGFDDLVGDLVGLMDHFAIDAADTMGLSLGGMTMLGLAIAHPHRVRSLVCCDARSDAVPPFVEGWNSRIAAVRAAGSVEPLVAPTLERWFTPGFAQRDPEALDGVAAMIRATNPEGYIGCAEALKGLDYKRSLDRIAAPSLFVCGAQDQAAPPAEMRAMAALTSNGRYAEVDPGGHLCNIENPERFNGIVGDWLASAAGATPRRADQPG